MNKPISFLKNSLRENREGFTLLEIMIVIVIMMIVVTFIWSSFSKINKSQIIDKEIREVASMANDARQRTIFSKNDSVYGIHFESNKVVLFKGGTYSSSSADNEVKSLNSLVGISSITLSGGGSDIVFSRLTGASVKSGTVTFLLNVSPGTMKNLIISNTGIVEISS